MSLSLQVGFDSFVHAADLDAGFVDAKAFGLMAPVLGDVRARQLNDAVWDLEAVADIGDLRPLYRV